MEHTVFQRNFLALRVVNPVAARAVESALVRQATFLPLAQDGPVLLPGANLAAGGFWTGAATHALLDRVRRNGERSERVPVYWLSSEPADLVPALAAEDVSGLLRSGHLIVFAGSDWLGAWSRFLLQAPWEVWPLSFASRVAELTEPSTVLDPQFTQVLDGMYDAYRARVRQIEARLARLYPTGEPLRELLRSGRRRPRVLGLAGEGSSYQQFGMRDLIAGFTAAGWDARSALHSTGLVVHQILESIEAFRPDVLAVFSNFHLNTVQTPIPDLPRIIWDQDRQFVGCDQNWTQHFRPCDRVFVMIEEWRRRPDDSTLPCERLPMGANPEIYRPISLSVEDQARYASPVSFVGSFQADYLTQYLPDTMTPLVRDVFRSAHARLLESLPETGGSLIPDPGEILDRELRARGARVSPQERQNLVEYFLLRMVHQAIRVPYMEALLPFGLALWGSGWEQVPSLKSAARGRVENGEELNKLIQATSVNIFIVAGTVCHPRLFDTLAAGGFLLVGWIPERNPLEAYFEIGKEVDVFRSLVELREKVAFYLARPELRLEMGQRARARVLREHTMEHRVRHVIVPSLCRE